MEASIAKGSLRMSCIQGCNDVVERTQLLKLQTSQQASLLVCMHLHFLQAALYYMARRISKERRRCMHVWCAGDIDLNCMAKMKMCWEPTL